MSNVRKDWEEDLKRHLYVQIGGFYGLPKGWVKSFLPNLIDDLFNILGGYAEDWMVLQVKEKFNEFRLYWGWRDRDYSDDEQDYLISLIDKIEAVIDEYRLLSRRTCWKCGTIIGEYDIYCEKCKMD